MFEGVAAMGSGALVATLGVGRHAGAARWKKSAPFQYAIRVLPGTPPPALDKTPVGGPLQATPSSNNLKYVLKWRTFFLEADGGGAVHPVKLQLIEKFLIEPTRCGRCICADGRGRAVPSIANSCRKTVRGPQAPGQTKLPNLLTCAFFKHAGRSARSAPVRAPFSGMS